MKRSIRVRLFTGISLLIVFFVFLSWLLNTNFLGKYYIFQKEKNLLESSEQINEVYNGDPYVIFLELEIIERMKGLNITILDENSNIKYTSRVRNEIIRKSMKRLEQRFLPERLIKSRWRDLREGKVIVRIIKDPVLDTNLVYQVSLLNNGDVLLLSTPLAAIQESADIANRFFFFTGIITIIIGSITAFVFAKRFTVPVLELNDIAQRMSKLDFSKKYIDTTEDEIGELGNSINSLSDQLDKSISGLKDANEKLQEDIERERKIDEMRKEFVSSVSHELKTPIALIQGYAEGLKVNVVEDEESKNFYCDVIVDEASKMNKLVKDLLDLSRIESGFFQLERCIFDISLLVDHVLHKYDPIFKEKSICVQVEKEQHILVDGDSVRVEQVLVNYINNAINHMDERKILKIIIKLVQNKVRVFVFNSGKPILEESLDKLWTSFYKVDKARTRAYGGTGLGLAIVRAIQELHHNDFGVLNKDGGVEFWFELDQRDDMSE